MSHIFKNIYCSSVVGSDDLTAPVNLPFPEIEELQDRAVRGIAFFNDDFQTLDATGQFVQRAIESYYLTIIDVDGNIIHDSLSMSLIYLPYCVPPIGADRYTSGLSNFFYFLNPVKIAWKNSFVRAVDTVANVNIPFVVDYE